MGISWLEFAGNYKDFTFKDLFRMASNNNLARVRSLKEFCTLLSIPQRTMENWLTDGENHREPPFYVLLQSAYLLYIQDKIEIAELMNDEPY